MKQTTRRRTVNAALLLAIGTLASCGEGDLAEHHQDVLACAEAEEAGGSCGGDGAPPATEPENGPASQDPSAGAVTDGFSPPAGAIEPGDESIQGIDLSGYDLVFADEFQSTTLDTTKWKTSLEWGPDFIINGELQYYVDTQSEPAFDYDPFVFDGETVGIRAQRTPDELRALANDQPWLSGVLSGAGRIDAQYGYIEARVDLPAGAALWPTFWMLPRDPGARSPRLFIAAHDGGRPDSVFHDYQYLDDEGDPGTPVQFRVDEPSLSEGFHTVGVSWEPEVLVYYLDGIARFRIIGDRLPEQPMYPVLTFAIGGSFTGAPDTSTPESPELLVDYVRIWQQR